MVELLKTLTKNAEVERIIEKYGQGFDSIYFDGKADGFAEGRNEGRNEGRDEAKLEDARNFLANGIDAELISQCTGLSVDQIKNLEREL